MGTAASRNSPRSAGFQPAPSLERAPVTEYTARRPSHPDLGSIPYLVSTRARRSERVFVCDSASAAVDELFRQRAQYEFLLLSFVFMPDHAHFVIVPKYGYTTSQTMRLIKGSVARRVKLVRAKSVPIWQEGFRDNAAQTLDELNAYITYVERNPVVAGLVDEASAYPYSSGDGRCLEDYRKFFEIERE